MQGDLVRDEPLRFAQPVREQLDNFQQWLVAPDHIQVVGLILLRHLHRKNLMIATSEHFLLARKSTALDKSTFSSHQPQLAILRRIKRIRQIVE